MTSTGNGDPVSCPYDHAEALRRFDDSPDACAELVYRFVENCPVELQELRHAIDMGDSRSAACAAHRLHDALTVLAAHPARGMARTIERMIGQGDLAAAAGHTQLLSAEMEHLGDAMRHAVTLGTA